MPSNTYRLTLSSGQVLQIMGDAKNRTSWTIYNTSTTQTVSWSNTRLGTGGTGGFRVPSNTAFTLKIPEDDPSKEVWVYASGVLTIYVYEGFGGMD